MEKKKTDADSCWHLIPQVVSNILNFFVRFCNSKGGERGDEENSLLTRARQINNQLYEIHNDGSNNFELIVIFFHGYVRDRDSAADIHVSNWISMTEDKDAKKSEVFWPHVWLVDEFPNSRIYTIKYDARIRNSSIDGESDPYILAENMTQDIICTFGPEFWSRPVVLVGHSFGGIVIKNLLLFAQERLSAYNGMDAERTKCISNFLDSVKLIFYLSTPHKGMAIPADKLLNLSPNVQYAGLLNVDLVRLDNDFGRVRAWRDWMEAGVGEQKYTRWDSVGFEGILVPEGSSRNRSERYLTVPEDHFSISRPKSRNADSFRFLVGSIRDVLQLENVEIHRSARLNPSQILRAGDWRCSVNGMYRLGLKKADLVLYERGRGAIWQSNTNLNLSNCYCVMQPDGNAVIYAVGDGGKTPIWATNTCGHTDATHYVEVQNDGNTVMYDETGRPVWATNTWDKRKLLTARLTSGQVLERGQFITSQEGVYRLEMQEDCNLVLYSCRQSNAIWASNTYQNPPYAFCKFIMQADGNAVIYGGNTTPEYVLWSTHTASQIAGTHYIEVQGDGNVVMYDDKRRPVWATNTWRGPPNSGSRLTSGQVMNGGDSRVSLNRLYTLLMEWDGNLVLYKKDKGPIWASETSCQTHEAAARSGESKRCYFIMNPNGNAEIYAGFTVQPLWSTSTYGGTYGTCYIEVQNNGNVVMYDGNRTRNKMWATNTADDCE